MRKRVGTKLYDTETAILVDTTPEGIQVYRKKTSPQFFLYNPSGKTAKEMFFELPVEETLKYIKPNPKSRTASNNSNTVRFKPYDLERIRVFALKAGMSINNFLLMLVDEYERHNK